MECMSNKKYIKVQISPNEKTISEKGINNIHDFEKKLLKVSKKKYKYLIINNLLTHLIN